jgi:hypothetical protein
MFIESTEVEMMARCLFVDGVVVVGYSARWAAKAWRVVAARSWAMLGIFRRKLNLAQQRRPSIISELAEMKKRRDKLVVRMMGG